MIEINLLPGTGQKKKRRKLALPGAGAGRKRSLPAFDARQAGMIAAVVLSVGAIAWMMLSTRQRIGDLEVAIEGARADSIRYAGIIAANQELQERQAIVAEKLQIIQEIDAARYIWAHVLDEVSRALPQHTWLNNLSDVSPDPRSTRPRIAIEGRTGSTFAMTTFMTNLENSPFLSGVRLIDHRQVTEADRTIYAFNLEMTYRQPGPEAIRTVPLFVEQEAN